MNNATYIREVGSNYSSSKLYNADAEYVKGRENIWTWSEYWKIEDKDYINEKVDEYKIDDDIYIKIKEEEESIN